MDLGPGFGGRTGDADKGRAFWDKSAPVARNRGGGGGIAPWIQGGSDGVHPLTSAASSRCFHAPKRSRRALSFTEAVWQTARPFRADAPTSFEDDSRTMATPPRFASQKIPSHAHSVELTVPFHDIDALRVVWHGHYLKYLEIARCELLKQCGLDVMQMVELGYRFMVSDISCRHTNALTYGDRFRVTAWFTETEHRIGIAYEVFNLTTQKRSARAHSTLITVSGEGKLCLSTPAPIFERLPKLERAD